MPHSLLRIVVLLALTTIGSRAACLNDCLAAGFSIPSSHECCHHQRSNQHSGTNNCAHAHAALLADRAPASHIHPPPAPLSTRSASPLRIPRSSIQPLLSPVSASPPRSSNAVLRI